MPISCAAIRTSSPARDSDPLALPALEVAPKLLEALRREDFEVMPPAERRRFVDRCRRCAELAEPRPDTPKSGVLFDLKNGTRHE